MRTLSFLPHDKRVDAGKDPAVPGPEIELEHGVDLRHIAAGLDVEGVQQEGEVAIDAPEGGVPGMHDEEPHHAHGHLHHFVGMRVVHERAAAPSWNS